MQAIGQIPSTDFNKSLKQVTRDFSPISLAEMDRVKLLDRFDRTFVLLDRSLKYNRFKNKLITLNKLSHDANYNSVFVRS